ncbi:hypothetical protein, partial [Parasutterella excrementihominis]|uniref:hypothetical protein n=1 Tax=Parasutterella excrementihominis TaxID=487175 RepID=UPI003AB7A2F7
FYMLVYMVIGYVNGMFKRLEGYAAWQKAKLPRLRLGVPDGTELAKEKTGFKNSWTTHPSTIMDISPWLPSSAAFPKSF